jgi:hypothetical protein
VTVFGQFLVAADMRAAPALPPRIREKITCPVSARVASCG